MSKSTTKPLTTVLSRATGNAARQKRAQPPTRRRVGKRGKRKCDISRLKLLMMKAGVSGGGNMTFQICKVDKTLQLPGGKGTVLNRELGLGKRTS